MKRPVHKKEILHNLIGFSDAMVMQAVYSHDSLISWEYNYYHCIDNLHITENDKAIIKKSILEIFSENSGFASDSLLYDKMLVSNPSFLKKNGIGSKVNLFYVVFNLFSDEFYFKRPYISENKDMKGASVKDVILTLMNSPKYFTYQQFSEVCKRMKWPDSTCDMALCDIEKEYLKISVDEYIINSSFELSDNVIKEIRSEVDSRM